MADQSQWDALQMEIDAAVAIAEQSADAMGFSRGQKQQAVKSAAAQAGKESLPSFPALQAHRARKHVRETVFAHRLGRVREQAVKYAHMFRIARLQRLKLNFTQPGQRPRVHPT